MSELSYEAAFGGEVPVEGKPSGKVKDSQTLEYGEATGLPPPAANGSIVDNIGGFLTNKQSYKDMAGYAAGVGAQLNDMFTGLGKSLLGGAAYLTERAATKGEMVKQVPMEPGGKTGPAPNRSAPKAQRAKDMFPEELATPWKKVAEAMGPEAVKAYEDNGVGWVMGKISEVIEKGGKAAEGASGMPASDFINAVDLFTGILGARALKPQAQAMLKQRIGQMRSEMKTAKKGRDLTPEELAAAYTGTQKFRPGDIRGGSRRTSKRRKNCRRLRRLSRLNRRLRRQGHDPLRMCLTRTRSLRLRQGRGRQLGHCRSNSTMNSSQLLAWQAQPRS